MTTRRTFLQGAACALPAATGGWRIASAAASPERRAAAFHAVLVGHQAATLPFGHALGAHGATLLQIAAGDITEPWLGTIRPAWTKGPAAIAGLTAPGALFCLEQLAWSHGLRVVFHAEHIVHSDGTAAHQLLRGGSSIGLDAAALHGAGPQWPTALAQALAARRAPPARRLGPSVAALEPTLPPDAQLFTSWIIAAA